MEIIAAVVIISFAAFLLIKTFSKSKKGDCGCGGCSTKKVKSNK